MHDHLMRRFSLAGWLVLLLLAAGCFQPAGGGLESTGVAQAIPTFTPFPSDTPSPLPPPSDTPTEFIVPSDTPTFEIIEIQPTEVAQIPTEEQLDPIWQTATAVFLANNGGQPQIVTEAIIPLENQEAPTLDPLLASATALVQQATGTAAVPYTQTAQAIFGFPTATQFFFQPTYTLAGPIPQGQDCVYEVQPGDPNLYKISLKFGVTYMSIANATHMVNPDLIHVGDRLIIPGCGTTGYVPPPTSTPGSDDGSGGYVPPSSSGSYTVVTGDTLFALSLRWNTTVEQIAALNGIPNVNLIYIGQTLQIP